MTTNILRTTLLAALLLTLTAGLYAQIPIDSARSLPIGTTVTVTGIVTNGGELGTIRYMEDGTAGIAAYSSTMNNVQRGDSVTVTGVLKLWSDLLEIDPVSSFTVHSSNNPLPMPQLITPNQLGPNYIGELISMQGIQFQNAGGTFSGNTNYNITGSGGQTAEIRINLASNLVGKPIPVGAVDLVGIASQYYSTYQLLLRDTNDIIPQASIAITSPVTQTNITTSSFALNWTTDNPGNAGYYYGYTPQLELGGVAIPGSGTQHTANISGLNPADILYVQVFSTMNNDTAFSGLRAYATQSLSSGDIKVYFTKDVDTSYATYQAAVQLDDAMDDTLIAYIDRAQHTVDVAIYNFNVSGISNIVTALNSAHNRGVVVRVIHDGGSNNLAIPQLSGIYSLASPTASPYGIMHNKFVVIDAKSNDPMEPILWTGSMNFTETGINHYANNVVIFQDQTLAKAYTIEFEEMWGDTGAVPNSSNARFGPDKLDNTPHEYVIGGRRVEMYMSPSDGVNEIIKQKIAGADHEFFVETMLITRSDIGYAIRDAYQAGAEARVMVNDTGACSVYVNGTLMNHLGPNYREYGESYILHHKLMVADYAHPGADPLVLTGCHNWSNAANQRNDENTVIIHDSVITNLYYQEFMKRWPLGVILTGIGEGGSVAPSIHLFPNPASGSFTIELPHDSRSSLSVSLFDLNGRLVHQEHESGFRGRRFEVNTSGISSGLYMVRVDQGNNRYSGKLIIE